MFQLRHFGFIVDDMEEAIDFYVGVLGLSIKKEAFEKGKFISTILGNEVEVKTCKLTHKIELLEYVKGYGRDHIAFTVSKDMFKKFDLISKPKTSPDGRVRVAFCYVGKTFIELVYEIPRRNISK